MTRLHRDLPWFVARPVTVDADVARADLGGILARHGFALHDIDGKVIGSWADLARRLEDLFGAQRYPSDPRQKVPQLLAKASAAARGRAVLRWRNAATSAAADPALLLEFASLCTGTSMPVFVDLQALPVRPEPDAPTALHRGDAGEAEPDVAALAGAPDHSWWKPRPGEMTR